MTPPSPRSLRRPFRQYFSFPGCWHKYVSARREAAAYLATKRGGSTTRGRSCCGAASPFGYSLGPSCCHLRRHATDADFSPPAPLSLTLYCCHHHTRHSPAHLQRRHSPPVLPAPLQRPARSSSPLSRPPPSTMGTGVSKDGTIGDGIRMGAKIGSGGFSEVYSGTLKTGTPYVLWLGGSGGGGGCGGGCGGGGDSGWEWGRREAGEVGRIRGDEGGSVGRR